MRGNPSWKKGTIVPGSKLWKKGQSGNPKGGKKLPEEINAMKHASLEKAIEILHEHVQDPVYVKSLAPDELFRFLEVTFDRFGLPKVLKNEVTNLGSKLIVIRNEAKQTENKR